MSLLDSIELLQTHRPSEVLVWWHLRIRTQLIATINTMTKVVAPIDNLIE